jgi:hypothetical protein
LRSIITIITIVRRRGSSGSSGSSRSPVIIICRVNCNSDERRADHAYGDRGCHTYTRSCACACACSTTSGTTTGTTFRASFSSLKRHHA